MNAKLKAWIAAAAEALQTRAGRIGLSALGLAVVFASLVLLQRANPPPLPEAPRYDKPDDRLVALIDGELPIYLSDLEREARLEGRIEMGERLDPNAAETRRLLSEVIDQTLLARHAERLGVDRTVEARQRIAAARTRILASIFLESQVEDVVTEEAVREVYAQQKALITLGDEVRARHILVADEAAARDIARRIEAGETFGELARTRSLDAATRSLGGDLGYFTAETMTAEISSAAFRTSVGALAEPFESELGWHVLQVEDRRAARPPRLEALRGDISRFLTLEVVQDVIRDVRRGVDIEVFDPADAPPPPGADEGPGAEPAQDADEGGAE